MTLKRLKGSEKDLILTKQESFLEHKLGHIDDKLGNKTSGNKSIDQRDRSKERQKLSSRYVL